MKYPEAKNWNVCIQKVKLKRVNVVIYVILLCIILKSDFWSVPIHKCGIIYKEVLDHSAEWRYYGAGDNKSSNPTRCGIPIDPLLEVSSYGCKVYVWAAFYL